MGIGGRGTWKKETSRKGDVEEGDDEEEGRGRGVRQGRGTLRKGASGKGTDKGDVEEGGRMKETSRKGAA